MKYPKKAVLQDPFVLRYNSDTRDKLEYISDFHMRTMKGQFRYMVDEEYRRIKLMYGEEIKEKP